MPAQDNEKEMCDKNAETEKMAASAIPNIVFEEISQIPSQNREKTDSLTDIDDIHPRQ